MRGAITVTTGVSIMRQGSAQKLSRRNLTLADSAIANLEELKQLTGAPSDSEVIRHALRVYKTLYRDDVEIVLREKTTGKESHVVLP
jgi:sugar/nucleoside kinase (ribokinase family)